ncbi:MAG TPA: GNAT family N-acetyltransferase [Desulfobacteraceae bacterium]|mgnify:CR=1 FL=1|nr:GNAT family N-acetyltransferase [Desulfobacteraceae bacterium]
MRPDIKIRPFAPGDEVELIPLIVGIQTEEFNIPITAADQPDLMDIPGFYQANRGNFWVAESGGRIVGTVALLDIGGGKAALRKMFVDKGFRGNGTGTSGLLLRTLLSWAGEKDLGRIFLGTTSKFLAAHRFYEKNGFLEIDKTALPGTFPVMSVDTKFYEIRI